MRRRVAAAGYEYCASKILTRKVIVGEDEVVVIRSCVIPHMSYTISYELIGAVRESEYCSMSESSKLPTEIEGDGLRPAELLPREPVTPIRLPVPRGNDNVQNVALASGVT